MRLSKLLIVALWVGVFANSCASEKHTASKVTLPEVVPDWRGQVKLFENVYEATTKIEAQVIKWIKRHQNELGPTYLFYLSNLVVEQSPDEGLKWYAIAYLRSSYDADRCVDSSSAAGGLRMIMANVAPKTSQYLLDHQKRLSRVGLEVLKRKDLFKSQTSPMWVCVHSMSSFSPGGNLGIKSENEWPRIQQETRTRNERAFKRMNSTGTTNRVSNPVVESTNYPIKFTVQIEMDGRPLELDQITQCRHSLRKDGRWYWYNDSRFRPEIPSNGVLRIWTDGLCRKAVEQGFPEVENGNISFSSFLVTWLDDAVFPTIAMKYSEVSDTYAGYSIENKWHRVNIAKFNR